jgi:phage shock protein C
MERRLYRSRKNRVIAGVAGGIGEYFDIDPVFVRVIFVLATLAGASGLLAYIILWIVVPKERFDFEPKAATAEGESDMEGKDIRQEFDRRRKHNGMVGGTVMIVLGVLFLANNYLPHFDFSDTWPLILVAIGAALILNSIHRDEKGEPHES